MPLHLLGKKSWNVYNAKNIARVRRDEAEVQVANDAREQRLQDVESERRLAILRGEVPPPAPSPSPSPRDTAVDKPRSGSERRKRRKRPDEDDTEFELRLARQDNHEAAVTSRRHSTSCAPIVDSSGHIDLLGSKPRQVEKNAEVEREDSKKRREYEDQYTMRFSNAAGRDGLTQQPWYSQSTDLTGAPASLKDAFGKKDDRGRRDRDAKRLMDKDPLAIMKWGASKTREVALQRKKLQEERELELKQLKAEQDRRDREKRREEKRHRRSRRSSRSPQERRPGRRSRSRDEHTGRDRDDETGRRRRRARSPEYRSRSPEFRARYPGFRTRSPEYRTKSRTRRD